MIIELDIDSAQAGIVLEALADYAERVRFEADSAALGSTGPSQALTFLARAITQTEAAVFEQLVPYADAIPPVARRLDQPIPYTVERSEPAREAMES